MRWRDSHHPARLEERLEGGRVRCHLSPRNCVIAGGEFGFCGVRGNVGGRLVTFNFGKGVHPTEETIETEAVNHYAPGERILSLGNVGCMLACEYCHNWKTSQSRHVDDRDVHAFTPEEIVALAERLGIRMLSWTYNDPVVWHEFVLETAALAKSRGIGNLYKSAFYITPEAVEELLPVMDIFSVSLKTVDPVAYRRVTKGRVEPVLEATKLVHRAGKHLETSCLMVTDLSDDEATARGVAEFVLRELDENVPLHFVRFHPDYKMTDRGRTPVERLHRARAIAREMGVRHVYLGNVHDAEATSTTCACGARLVERFGLSARAVGLDASGRCAACGAPSGVR
ncbi:MAG TPA: AmmeMemoRadiSam system radical SAM enzyme, partial [bacterium]|nr:AmmeMemoRadiSam system radical SAM enzyme [bacterium]